MTKHKMLQPEIIPGFDVIKWKRDVHADFRRETEGMTDEEVREYFRKGNEEFQEEMRICRAELAKRLRFRSIKTEPRPPVSAHVP